MGHQREDVAPDGRTSGFRTGGKVDRAPWISGSATPSVCFWIAAHDYDAERPAFRPAGSGMRVATRPLMADVATRLRSARERAGLSIEDIAARTKINPVTLGAIERGEFERLPGEFFARAFVRSYAQELRLPVSEVMAAYDAARPKPAAARDDAPATAAAPRFNEALRTLQLDSATGAWSLAALAIVVMAVIFGLNRPEAPKALEPRAVGTSGAAPIAPGAPAAAPVAAQPAPVTPRNLTLEIRPSRRLWVTGHADGKRVLFRNIEPGEHVVVEGTDELAFRVGDAGAFEYTLNGAAGKPPGRSGEVREFRITRENYREFAR